MLRAELILQLLADVFQDFAEEKWVSVSRRRDTSEAALVLLAVHSQLQRLAYAIVSAIVLQ